MLLQIHPTSERGCEAASFHASVMAACVSVMYVVKVEKSKLTGSGPVGGARVF